MQWPAKIRSLEAREAGTACLCCVHVRTLSTGADDRRGGREGPYGHHCFVVAGETTARQFPPRG